QQVIDSDTGAHMGNSFNGQARFQDVINVPAGKTVVIRIEFKDYLGTMVYHCHAVNHEDDGMMALVQVLPQQPIQVVGAGTGGVSVAAGDINADGFDDIIAGAGAGGGPNVIVFSGKDGSLLRNFFAYDSAFTGGVTVAAGDVDGDGRFEIITGAGPGGGPNVGIFDGDAQRMASFFAFDPAFTGGVYVATGRVRGIGFASII